MSKINLNFLPLNDNDFKFKVFRKKIVGEVRNYGFGKIYRLYENTRSTKKENYEVFLMPEEGFENYEIHSNHSISLTNWFIFEKIKANFLKNESKIKYKLIEKNKDIKISIIVSSFSEGDQTIFLSPYYLRSEKKFGLLIDFKFEAAPNQNYNKRVQQLSLSLDERYGSNKNYYSEKNTFFSEFIKKYLHQINNIIENKIFVTHSLLSVSSYSLEKKQYVVGNERTSFSQFMGVKSFGPYESVTSLVNFIFIFEERYTQFANELYLSLIGKTNPGTFTGMEQMFKISLTKQNTQKIIIKDYKDENLLKVIDQLIYISKEKSIVSIFIEDYIEEEGNSKPYYFMKYHCVQNDIPLQVVNYNKLSKSNTLKWSTSNLALQIFSKLGGKPWIVNPSKKNCLILGIGSSHKINPETKLVQKYFAYSVCLDSSGLYKKLEVLSESEDESSYLEKLEKNLLKLLDSRDFKEYLHCVLHLPFKIKNSEIEVLQKAIRKKSNMDFKVVKINTKNKFFGFSNHNTLVPYESTYIALNNNEFLVWFEGLQYGREYVDKMLSNPVHIQFLNMDGNDYYREDYKPYLQDIINLSGANWRGFNAKSVPISIFYSKLITNYISEFGDLMNVDNKTIPNNEKPWFL